MSVASRSKMRRCALCSSHSRCDFIEAQTVEPEGVHEALLRIGAPYAIEHEIRGLRLTG